jgi:hypothetical protein
METGNQTISPGAAVVPGTGGRGGARPGAGRPRGLSTLQAWQRFERLIRSVAAKEITREQLRTMAKADPWRFVERVLLPLMAMDKRGQVGRVGVSVGEGASRTQFVLDLGDREGDGRRTLEQAGDVLGQLMSHDDPGARA